MPDTYQGWNYASRLHPKEYDCAYCGRHVISDVGFINANQSRLIYVCPCGEPTSFNGIMQNPLPSYGDDVTGIKDEGLLKLYDEAKRCYSAAAFTAVILCCRKLLMHVAVEKGAKEGSGFIEYVEFLDEKHFIPVDSKPWIDYIRQKGNEATHAIIIGSKEDAQLLIDFSAMLLKINYEYPSIIASKTPPKSIN